ncbi:hypothetical protein ACIQV1_18965 [Streptomyces rubiginosohelvolus]|uniref:hypothetical protein n=1 Tax=Streptomyces rubiginosohelvolus TaxID=67362 RepID=UPI003804817D
MADGTVVSEIRVRTGPVLSLVWDGDDLLDPVGGRRRWSADGTEHRRERRRFSEVYDRAVTSPSGRWTVVFGERGSRGLLLDGGRVVRELSRDKDHAEDFDYPVGLGTLSDGREVLVHCPERYDRLQIEDVATGERLATGAGEEMPSLFHARLAVSPGGRWLMSAGWVWHPAGVCHVYELDRALADPSVLDGEGLLDHWSLSDAEVDSACWLDGDQLAVVAGEVGWGRDVGEERARHRLGVWSCSSAAWLYRHDIQGPIGTILGCGDAVLALYGYPRLFDIRTGALITRWPGLAMPRRQGSYGVTHIPTPVGAVHPDGSRVALALESGIAVIRLP